MKKTILLIAALVIGATSANAQRFISVDGLQDVRKAITDTEIKTKKTIKKSNQDLRKDEVSLITTVDFSDPTAYELVTLAGHTGGQTVGKFTRFDTSATTKSALQTNYSVTYRYWGIANSGFFFLKDWMGTDKIGDGFALVSPRDVWGADGGTTVPNTKAYNTAIKVVEPINTTELNAVVVAFNQFTTRFNADRYYIDYSTDANFNTYDSIEINIKGVHLNVNDDAYGRTRVTLPVSETINKPALYIRLRYFAKKPEGNLVNQPSGYWWFIDEINVYNGKEYDVQVISQNHFNSAYHVIPKGLPMDTIGFYTVLDNIGGKTLYNGKLQEKIHTRTGDDAPYTYTFINVTNLTEEPFNLSTDMKTILRRFEVDSARAREIYAEAASAALSTADLGMHAVTQSIAYSLTDGGAQDQIVTLKDTINYKVIPVPDTTDAHAAVRWAADIDLLMKRQCWKNGKDEVFISENTAGASLAGYQVCNRFITPSYLPANEWYIKGVEVVPAADSCLAGARISASIKYYDHGATDETILVKDVTNAAGTPVVSSTYTVTAADLNNGLFTDPNVGASNEFNSIFLKFNEAGLKLEPNKWYYACYQLRNDAKFFVGHDNHKRVKGGTFKQLDYRSVIVKSPTGVGENPWGMFIGGGYVDYFAPMVRLMVSKKFNALTDVENSVSPFSFNAYPNPAQEEVSIEYTLNTNGKVIITLTDITGREVLRLNQGNKTNNTTTRVSINTQNLNNGTYFYTLNVNGVKETKKLVINK